ncbi:hypothetical protein WR25_01461 isoform A [Diploscapter pachys]|uniref:Conserved oligomeric Golgi complex subunit 2 n=1 Tax=Diploscapter pachys TaxID=2018661 RepID=A0A2A2LGY0_9BILA|nr:hypothetical protein WR25_01461 isoform A [Diploscapter pachys]
MVFVCNASSIFCQTWLEVLSTFRVFRGFLDCLPKNDVSGHHRMVNAAEEPGAARRPAVAAAVVNGTGTGKGEGGTGGHSSGTQSANPISGIDDVQLCFNKAHFTRADFSVQRFLNLTRRRAGLRQIQSDLRTFLKSIQNSMIELINDDYADFVHLSSRLVGLEDSVGKIEKDLKSNWKEFEDTTKDSIGVAEAIEEKCQQLTSNRLAQAKLRGKILFVSGLHELTSLLASTSSANSLLWLEKVASCIVELETCKGYMESHSECIQLYQKAITQLEELLCAEGVKSVSSDCATLPSILSILSLTQSTDTLTARIVSDVIYPKLVRENADLHTLLCSVFDRVLQMRSGWSNSLGPRFSGSIQSFLDSTLLTFVLTFFDKCMSIVIVPSNPRLFHTCFLATQNFINQYPNGHKNRQLLKAIREKFNLIVYFKLETHKQVKKVDESMKPESFAVAKDTADADGEEMPLKCSTSQNVIDTIRHVWNEQTFLPPLADKMWDLTLRLLAKHVNWIKAMNEHFASKPELSEEDIFSLCCILYDCNTFHSIVFDFALERIWTIIRDLDLECNLFGQCLTQYSNLAAAQANSLEQTLLSTAFKLVIADLNGVSEIPKQYRWTKKLLPTSCSAYVNVALDRMQLLRKGLTECGHAKAEALQTRLVQMAIDEWVPIVRQVFFTIFFTNFKKLAFRFIPD